MKKQLYFDIRIFLSQFIKSPICFILGLMSLAGIGIGAAYGMEPSIFGMCSGFEILFTGFSIMFLFCYISGKRMRRNLSACMGHPITRWNFILSKYLLCIGFLILKAFLYTLSAYIGKTLFGTYLPKEKLLAWLCFCCVTTIIIFLSFLFLIKERDNYIILILLAPLFLAGGNILEIYNTNRLIAIIFSIVLLWLLALPVAYLFYKKVDLK